MIRVLSGDRGGFISIKQSCWGGLLPILYLIHALGQHHPPLLPMSFFPKKTEKSSSDSLCWPVAQGHFFACPGDVGICSCLQEGRRAAAADTRQPLTCPCSWLPDFAPNTGNNSPIPLSWNTDNPIGFLFKLESGNQYFTHCSETLQRIEHGNMWLISYISLVRGC